MFMPTYDYRCAGCGHEFELFQSITDAPLKKCPKCGRRRLERLIGTGAALIFRGSGFYVTDYKKGGASSKGSASREPKKDTPSSGSSDGSSSVGGDDGAKKD